MAPTSGSGRAVGALKLPRTGLLAAFSAACTWPTLLASCSATSPIDETVISELLCSKAWFEAVEARVPTGDGRGHGPDIGSDEWKSVVEFRLGIRDTPGVPDRSTEDWCRHIDRLVFDR